MWIFEFGFGGGFAEARLEVVEALARLPGRTKGVWDLSTVVCVCVCVWTRVGVEAGGGMVKDWRLGLGLTDGVGVLVLALVLFVVLFCLSACRLTEPGRESEPLIVLPLACLRLLRIVTVAGMLLA